MAAQAYTYIIYMLPPAPSVQRVGGLIPEILAANGYILGCGLVDFQVDELALQDSLFVFSMKAFEERTGRKVDMGRSKVHAFSGTGVRGKLLAVFLTGETVPSGNSTGLYFPIPDHLNGINNFCPWHRW